jgi:peptide/nickel transport system permease protein
VVTFLARRLFQAVSVLFVVSLITFLIFFMVPKLLGTDPAVNFAGRTVNAQSLRAIDVKFGFDKPILTQYWDYVSGIFTGRHFDYGSDKTYCPAPCLGYSFKTDLNVSTLIASRFPVTLSLAVGAPILWLLGGLTVGISSALRPRSLTDRAGMMVALAGVSLPVYFTGALLLLVFVYTLHWFSPVTYVPITENPLLWAKNLTLPWISLAFLYAANYARFTRASMIETLGEDYIRTARAKGLSEPKVVGKHAMRAVLTPIITLFGLDLGALLGGAILTESTFSLPGLGYMAVQAIAQKDLSIIMGVTLVGTVFIVVANIVVDLLYAVIDPRVRLA